jgi:chemotaxis family two-component system sensor kinase Cph1
LLLVGSATTLEIIGGAGDIDGRLVPNWVGQSLTEVLGQTIPTEFVASPEGVTVPLVQVRGTSELFDVVAHRTAERLLIELEPAAVHTLSAATILGRLKAANRTFERAGDLRDLCERAAAAFRLITGFDRVMVYRFLDDGAGVVLGEDREPALGSFLNHHFPASDIPKQARALYVRNRVRVIRTSAIGPRR